MNDLLDSISSDDFLLNVSRGTANQRERFRMRKLNEAFCQLKSRLPWIPADSKLTKLEILRLASDYIAYLTVLLYAS